MVIFWFILYNKIQKVYVKALINLIEKVYIHNNKVVCKFV